MLTAIVESQNITQILQSFTGNTSAETLRSKMGNNNYESAYVKALDLYKDNHIVVNGKIVKHSPKWTRRVR